MMTLEQASSYFDETEVVDAYTGALLFLGQVDPYDESKRDAMVAYRRVLSVAPGTLIPDHRCIRIFGKVWIVAGESETDGLAVAHRTKYVLQAADGYLHIGRLNEFLTGAQGTRVFGFPAWIKDAKEVAESSDVANLYELIFARDVDVRRQDLVWRDGGTEMWVVTSARKLPSEFMGADAERQEGAQLETVQIQSNDFDVTAGKAVLGAPVAVPGLRLRWQALFRYDSQMAARFQEGDFVMALPLTAAVGTKSRITSRGEMFAVLNVMPYPNAKVVHLRKA